MSISVSEAPLEAPKPKKFESYNPESYKTDEQKKEEVTLVFTSMSETSLRIKWSFQQFVPYLFTFIGRLHLTLHSWCVSRLKVM